MRNTTRAGTGARLSRWGAVALAVGLPILAVTGLCGRPADRRRGPDLDEAAWATLADEIVERRSTLSGGAVPPAGREPPAEVLEAADEAGGRRVMPPLDPAVQAEQRAAYLARRAKTIVDLQQFRRTSSIRVIDAEGRQGRATLVNLNPVVNTWYLLTLRWADQSEPSHYHLTNVGSGVGDLALDPDYTAGLVIADAQGTRPCDLWSPAARQPLLTAAASPYPYAPLCDGRVTLRLPTAGRKTSVEMVTDLLRDRLWGGEAVTRFVRETFLQDTYAHGAELGAPSTEPEARWDWPAPAALDPVAEGLTIGPGELGLTPEEAGAGRLAPGRWYRVRGMPGVFVSAIWPNLVTSEILRSHREVVNPLDVVEGTALAYLVAFDLGRFRAGFALGTDHPRLGWSDRVPSDARDAALPGPDGIATGAPLVSTGILDPTEVPRVAATFTGGFKRAHGAFRSGELALRHHGSHYGFVESGVVFSKLHPGLSTLLVLDDDTVHLRTWAEEDDALLERVAFARQNGVPLIERDPATGEGVPGPLVARWGAGNWSGSQDGRLRSLRAGICLQERHGVRFLVYGYFSTATPSAMTRVFQGYACGYAMHLDMNALEHTYLALYHVHGGDLAVEHLVRGMEALERRRDDRLLPRFLGYADNRDFFYLSWREGAGG